MNKDLKAIKGKFYISRLVEEGEHEHQDFKFQITDINKIAHSISAFANNDGGRLLIGVKDNGTIAGIRNEEDVYMLEAAAEMCCRPAVPIELTAFACEGGAVVLRAVIPRAGQRPVKCREADGSWHAYYRVADENVLAHPLMVRAWEEAAENRQGNWLALSPTETAVLKFLREHGPADEGEVACGAHLSAYTADTVIVRLAVMGLICFTHIPFRGFKLTLSAT